jgi:hypothetical protein
MLRRYGAPRYRFRSSQIRTGVPRFVLFCAHIRIRAAQHTPIRSSARQHTCKVIPPRPIYRCLLCLVAPSPVPVASRRTPMRSSGSHGQPALILTALTTHLICSAQLLSAVCTPDLFRQPRFGCSVLHVFLEDHRLEWHRFQPSSVHLRHLRFRYVQGLLGRLKCSSISYLRGPSKAKALRFC